MSTPAYTGFTRWLVTLTVILVAVVEVLDMTIVNITLPNMKAALGADNEQITWVLTSYVISAAICMPLTGFLVHRIGQKKLLLLNIGGFLITSVLCGLSTSLVEMIVFRILQGIFGASLVPLSQIILRDAFPREEQGKAMAIWGIGIMVAPVLGPTVGGYITEALNWCWIFYINVPACSVAFLLALQLVKENPTRQDKIDWLGMILMSVGVGSMQIFLDRGNHKNWFDSHEITLWFITAVMSLMIFIWRGWRINDNIINFKLFLDRNFSCGCLLMMLYCIGIFGIMALQPIMLETYMHYSTSASGLIMAPRGLAAALAMMMVPALLKKFDPRHLIISGLLASAFGTYLMTTFSLTASKSYIMWTTSFQGFGMGLIVVPLSLITFSTLPKTAAAEAAGIYSFSRNTGISIGVSILSTILSRQTQTNWNRLGGHISIFNPNLTYWLSQLRWKLHSPLTLHVLQQQLASQAGMVAFNYIFWLITIAFLILIPIVLMLEKPERLVSMGEAAH